MSQELHTHALTGCVPTPLAHYLKALGILRLVSQQADPTAQGWWAGDVFSVRTHLDADLLMNFFLANYQPTPVIAPWNGGSGFYPKDNKQSISTIAESQASRLSAYQDAIAVCNGIVSEMGLKERPDGENKARVLITCRNLLSDMALEWLDATYVLLEDGPKYPPLLGTGGNDGRLDFTNNFMQRLLDLIDGSTGLPTESSAKWLNEALFQGIQSDLQSNSILGQFDPGAVDRPVNPWDFVLMIEGALAFASAAVKRHEATVKGALSFPFCVRPVGAGYGSAAASDEGSCRAEMWLPLWSRTSTFSEIEYLMAEGRAVVGNRTARNGVDFARAVSTLGVDRGISQFTRFGFHARNGLAYFAVPMGRFNAEPRPQVDLLNAIDNWLDSFRRAASADTAPSSAARALRRLDTAILDLCQRGGNRPLQSVMIALADAQSVLATSRKWREGAYQKPVPLLEEQWIHQANDQSPEFRLALSLASIHSPTVGDFRQHIEPVEVRGRWPQWSDEGGSSNEVVWQQADLVKSMLAVLRRRAIAAVNKGERVRGGVVLPISAKVHAAPADVALFLQGTTQDLRIEALTRAFALLNWREFDSTANAFAADSANVDHPPAAFALLKLCHSPYPVYEIMVPLEPTILTAVAAGRTAEATRMAARRLRGSGLPTAIQGTGPLPLPRRLAASMLFPIAWDDLRGLAKVVLNSNKLANSVT